MSLIVYGALGTMGKLTVNYIKNLGETVYGVDAFSQSTLVQSEFPKKTVDGVIDFSHPSQLKKVLTYALTYQVPLVLATTGYTRDDETRIHEASKQIPIFKSSNLSYGVHLIKKILNQYTKDLENEYDIEIIEKHHKHKVDAPSGTALLLKDAIIEGASQKKTVVVDRTSNPKKRKDQEIGITSVRAGNIVGEHTVIFAGLQDTITLTHEAHSKEVFAQGAYKAYQFIKKQRPGLYSMDDLI
jgi:4-hydroxy-tetrahydrodipicolinate reductase